MKRDGLLPIDNGFVALKNQTTRYLERQRMGAKLIPTAFCIACVATIVMFLFSKTNTLFKVVVSVSIGVFGFIAFTLSEVSAASPFYLPPGWSFGPSSTQTTFLLGLMLLGSIAGAVASSFIEHETVRWKEVISALVATPITVIPVVQLLSKETDPNAFTFILAFALSYQGAVFWRSAINTGLTHGA